MSDPQPFPGYEEIAFYGRNCHSCIPAGQTPDQAARGHAEKYVKSYVHEVDDGYWVFADLKFQDEFEIATSEFLNTPVEEHIKRWEKGIKWRDRHKS